jgi:hypothetical protein
MVLRSFEPLKEVVLPERNHPFAEGHPADKTHQVVTPVAVPPSPPQSDIV